MCYPESKTFIEQKNHIFAFVLTFSNSQIILQFWMVKL